LELIAHSQSKQKVARNIEQGNPETTQWQQAMSTYQQEQYQSNPRVVKSPLKSSRPAEERPAGGTVAE